MHSDLKNNRLMSDAEHSRVQKDSGKTVRFSVLRADGSLEHVELSTQRAFQAMLRAHQAEGLIDGDKGVYQHDRLEDGVKYRPIPVRPPLRCVYILSLIHI